MGVMIKKEGVSAHLKWGDLYLIAVTASMFLFGLWGWYDGHDIGTPHAGWRFLFLFTVFITPALAVLLFWNPKNG